MIKIRFKQEGQTKSYHIEGKLIEIFDNEGNMIDYKNSNESEDTTLKNIINENLGSEIDMLELK